MCFSPWACCFVTWLTEPAFLHRHDRELRGHPVKLDVIAAEYGRGLGHGHHTTRSTIHWLFSIGVTQITLDTKDKKAGLWWAMAGSATVGRHPSKTEGLFTLLPIGTGIERAQLLTGIYAKDVPEGFVDIWACVDDVRKVRAAVQAIPAEVIVVPLLRVQFMADARARTHHSLVGGQTIKIMKLVDLPGAVESVAYNAVPVSSVVL
eukprot:COSAG02_NODE_6398_length_3599_cov_4.417143_5_plen_206_part_00